MRFTRKVLEQKLETLNARLTTGRHYEAQGRNGYTAIDEYGPDREGREQCLRTVATGSPRECWLAVLEENSNINAY